ncbi:MAG: YgaP-like transmembrane domain [Xenococcaceae cyanobacterium]
MLAGAVMAISGLAGSCLLYGLLGINTRKQNPQVN